MNWDAIGAIAELIGAIGVITSLVYLGVQLRHNNRSIRAASYQAVTTNLSNISGALGRDPSAAGVLIRGLADFDGLSVEERSQFTFLVLSIFRNLENIFYQYSQGMIDEAVWKGWAHAMTRNFWQPGTQKWWPTWRNDCHPEFREFLERSTPPPGDRIFADLVGIDAELGVAADTESIDPVVS